MSEEPRLPGAALALAAAVAVAAGALVAAAVDGAPYLDLGSLNPWVAVFAAALFCALVAVPFAANRIVRGARPERADAWEGAMLAWGALAALVLALGLLLVLPGDFSPGGSLLDAIGLLLAIEAGMVAGVLVLWLLAG